MATDSGFLRNLGYLLGNRINHGSFSIIHNGLQVDNADVVAVKIINLQSTCTSYRTRFLPRELINIQTLSHPNIIPVRKIAQTLLKVYIVMDYAPTNLRRQIELRSFIPEEQARKWFRQLASALEYLHRHQVAHRDIKIENILIDKNDDIKLCDFGFSKVVEKSTIQQDEPLSTTFCGSLGYCAPEILLRTPYEPYKTDVWSLGVVLYKMVIGGMPFGEGNDLGSVKRIAKAHTQMLVFPPYPRTSASCQDLIRALLTVETTRRITMLDISKFTWVNPQQNNPNAIKQTSTKIFQKSNSQQQSVLQTGVVGKEIIPLSSQSQSVISRLRNRLPSLTKRSKVK